MDRQSKFIHIKEELAWYGLSVIRSLGSGGFGEVVLANKDGKSVAVKCFTKNQIAKHPELTRYIRNQFEVMRALHHPNILRQEYNIDAKEHFFMVLEYCNLGNLLNEQVKKPHKVFSYEQTIRIAASILYGLREIHSNKFVHRDIKPENILINNENGEIVYKIADFGFARPVENDSAETHCGTSYYMAPEIYAGRHYGNAVDFWSLGVLMYFMLFGEQPFRSLTKDVEIQRKCMKGFDLRKELHKKQHHLDEEAFTNLCDFFRKVFVLDPNKRMGFNEMIKHPVFAKEALQTTNKDSISTNSSLEEDDGYHKEKLYMELEREKVLLLKECLARLATTYKAHLNGIDNRDIWAASYYILKAIVFFTKSIYISLLTKRAPHHDLVGWQQFCLTRTANEWVDTLSFNLKEWEGQMSDFYYRIETVGINIKGFKDSLTATVEQTNFNDFKGSYRTSIGNLFKQVHNDSSLAADMKLQVKLELFCCHLINRIFEAKHLEANFPTYEGRRKFEHKSFLKWIAEQNRESLEKLINYLNNKYMNTK